MTDQFSPITPPPEELRRQWQSECPFFVISVQREDWMIDRATQWGADQELEACVEWFRKFYKGESWMLRDLKSFKTARRPKPPSLKEQALAALNEIEDKMLGPTVQEKLIRRALAQLNG